MTIDVHIIRIAVFINWYRPNLCIEYIFRHWITSLVSLWWIIHSLVRGCTLHTQYAICTLLWCTAIQLIIASLPDYYITAKSCLYLSISNNFVYIIIANSYCTLLACVSGIPVRQDHSSFFMHHKFALLDGATVLSGSFNWTRQAITGNNENILITNNTQVVQAYTDEFEKLWMTFNPANYST